MDRRPGSNRCEWAGKKSWERFPPEIQQDRIVVSFDRLEDPQQDSEKRIEVEFSARVLRFGTEFSGWVYDSREPDLKQNITPGNATIRFVGDGLSVRTPTGGDLVQQLEIRPRVFTPNGDGVNDEAIISFDLRDLTAARPVAVQIWTLGRVPGAAIAADCNGQRQLHPSLERPRRCRSLGAARGLFSAGRVGQR